jgi:hypothetical protein
MRIVYLYNGNPVNLNKINETWGTSQGLAFQWKLMNQDVVEIDFNRPDLAKKLFDVINEKKTDVVLLSEAGTIPMHVSNVWKKSNFPNLLMVAEGCDEPQILYCNLNHTIPADIVWSSDLDSVNWYQSNGKKSFWIPHWADELIYSYVEDPCNGKISTSSGPRRGIWKDAVDALKSNFGDNFVAPRINGGDYLPPLANNELYSTTSMVFQASSYGEITRRIFEAALAGRVIICDNLSPTKHLNEIFVPDSDILVYDSIPDLIDKTRYYLQNHNERRDIAESAKKKCEQMHTASKRASQILEIFKKCNEDIRL